MGYRITNKLALPGVAVLVIAMGALGPTTEGAFGGTGLADARANRQRPAPPAPVSTTPGGAGSATTSLRVVVPDPQEIRAQCRAAGLMRRCTAAGLH